MPSRSNAIVAMLVAVCALAASSYAHAQAQRCGEPPDPRHDAAGYASWCTCMGGTYDYQTTACIGAHRPRRGGRSGASGDWGCYARARSGAWGNSWSWGSEAEARSRALTECRSRSRGRTCTIRYCQRGTSAARRPGPGHRPPPRAVPRGSRYAYSCSVCERKLRNDLLSGLGSARVQTYVRHAIAGYENCKRKARPPCTGGDILVRSVRNGCFGYRSDPAFRVCVGRVLGR